MCLVLVTGLNGRALHNCLKRSLPEIPKVLYISPEVLCSNPLRHDDVSLADLETALFRKGTLLHAAPVGVLHAAKCDSEELEFQSLLRQDTYNVTYDSFKSRDFTPLREYLHLGVAGCWDDELEVLWDTELLDLLLLLLTEVQCR
jgi:hypothetical protein